MRIVAAMVLLVGSAVGQTPAAKINGGSGIPYPNDNSVGTVCGYLAKVTSVGAAAKATKTDGAAIIGVANAPPGFMCGTSGTVLVARRDVVQVSFDGTPSAGDFACVSATVDGQLHDCGATASAACVGRISTPATNFGGFYNVSWGDCGVGAATPVLTPTTNTLTASTTSPAVGSSVVLTSTVASSAATGTVSFLDGSSTIGTGTLSGGSTAYTVNSITAGSHPYKAVYGGDGTYAGSTSNIVTATTPSAPHFFGGVGTGGGATGATASGSTAVLTGATGTLPAISSQTGTFSVSPSSQYIYFILQGSTHTFTVAGFTTTFTATPITFVDNTGTTVANTYLYTSPSYYSGTYSVVVN